MPVGKEAIATTDPLFPITEPRRRDGERLGPPPTAKAVHIADPTRRGRAGCRARPPNDLPLVSIATAARRRKVLTLCAGCVEALADRLDQDPAR